VRKFRPAASESAKTSINIWKKQKRLKEKRKEYFRFQREVLHPKKCCDGSAMALAKPVLCPIVLRRIINLIVPQP